MTPEQNLSIAHKWFDKKSPPEKKGFFVRIIGLEPTRLAAPDPKSGMSTNFTISAGNVGANIKRIINCHANSQIFFCLKMNFHNLVLSSIMHLSASLSIFLSVFILYIFEIG
jgi:hypothetical protein